MLSRTRDPQPQQQRSSRRGGRSERSEERRREERERERDNARRVQLHASRRLDITFPFSLSSLLSFAVTLPPSTRLLPLSPSLAAALVSRRRDRESERSERSSAHAARVQRDSGARVEGRHESRKERQRESKRTKRHLKDDDTKASPSAAPLVPCFPPLFHSLSLSLSPSSLDRCSLARFPDRSSEGGSGIQDPGSEASPATIDTRIKGRRGSERERESERKRKRDCICRSCNGGCLRATADKTSGGGGTRILPLSPASAVHLHLSPPSLLLSRSFAARLPPPTSLPHRLRGRERGGGGERERVSE